MKKINIKKGLWAAFLWLLVPVLLSAQSKRAAPAESKNINQWVQKHFSANKQPPFSFVYNGVNSSSFITKWKYRLKRGASATGQEPTYLVTYTDPKGGLEVKCVIQAFQDFNAVEWTLHFTNNSKTPSKIIESVHAADLRFLGSYDADPVIQYADGSNARISDFHPRKKVMTKGAKFEMIPEEGRSSQTFLPFFNIRFSEHTGVMVAIGWTGTWFARAHRDLTNELKLETGMAHLRTYLNPQESIRTPSTAILFWAGNNQYAGNNKFRRFILAHHTQKIDGKLAAYPVSNSFNYGDPAPCNEYSCLTTDYARAMVDRYKQFNLLSEVFWLDAGWYKGAGDVPTHNWANTVGNWIVDSSRFPNGLADIADKVHEVGSKFMVWFEPERVMKDSYWARLHPEFMLDAGKQRDAYLFNLGDAKARKWFCEAIAKLIKDNKIDYYRQDFNMEIASYWKQNDKADREGITEIRYIEGLYKFWDFLLERFAGLLIDNCASGGRRIDLETVSRSAPLWRTDYSVGEPVGYQAQTFGLNLYLPIHGTGTYVTNKYDFRSSLATCIVYNWKITEGDFSVTEMQACQQEFKEVRPFFYEDYYPLTNPEQTTSNKAWLAYELLRPSDNNGYILAFRRDSALMDFCTVKVQGLNKDLDYIVLNKDSGEEIIKSGRQLASGFRLRLKEARSSLLLKFYPTK